MTAALSTRRREAAANAANPARVLPLASYAGSKGATLFYTANSDT
jgi:hypothetical protein